MAVARSAIGPGAVVIAAEAAAVQTGTATQTGQVSTGGGGVAASVATAGGVAAAVATAGGFAAEMAAAGRVPMRGGDWKPGDVTLKSAAGADGMTMQTAAGRLRQGQMC